MKVVPVDDTLKYINPHPLNCYHLHAFVFQDNVDKSKELNELIVQGRKEAYETERLRKLLEGQVASVVVLFLPYCPLMYRFASLSLFTYR